jgi:hypothetical protein
MDERTGASHTKEGKETRARKQRGIDSNLLKQNNTSNVPML